MISIEEVKKISWYRQAGSAVPLPFLLPIMSIGGECPQFVNFGHDLGFILRLDGSSQLIHCFDAADAREKCRLIHEKAEREPAFFEELERLLHERGRLVEEKGLALIERGLDEDSGKAYSEWLEDAFRLWDNALFVDLLDVEEEEHYRFIFGEELPAKEELQKLFTPPEAALVQQEEAALLALVERKEQGEDIADELAAHAAKWWWINNDYAHAVKLTPEEFASRVERLLEHPEEREALAEELATARRQRQAGVKAREALPAAQRERLHFFLWATRYRDYRKRYSQVQFYVLLELARQLAAKEAIDVTLVQQLNPRELERALTEGMTPFLEEARRRQEGLMVYSKDSKQEFLSGKKAWAYYEAIEKSLARDGLSGNGASPGKATGRAKVILDQTAFSRFEQGDILVAPMTRPEYLPLMKKAAAIVTDEGGLTCHAAIVSRELGKPCVIGTQVASRVLNDGDLVEVDADKGVVRKI